METKTIPTKTFKEVHEELENESLFLHKKHNIRDFQIKADFLNDIGFNNSIATKIYGAISKNASVIDAYKEKYLGIYKFILEPQLERVCEKYNLYVRKLQYFLGDIPEKNIQDIMNFKVYINDLPISNNHKNNISHFLYQNTDAYRNGISNRKLKIELKDFKKLQLLPLLEIASVKSLLHSEAFLRSKERIIGSAEIEPKNQVDLDPIVLCKTIHGYIIITAWGDEANDELVLNQNQN